MPDLVRRVYAFMSTYLLVCSFWLTGKAFADIPKQLENKSSSEVIASFFTPPIGALIAAMVSTFGIYLVASILYVSYNQLAFQVCLA
jgi:chitin synthase